MQTARLLFIVLCSFTSKTSGDVSLQANFVLIIIAIKESL
jgi:hypothetical protein